MTRSCSRITAPLIPGLAVLLFLPVLLVGCEADTPPVSSWPGGPPSVVVDPIPPIPADELPELPAAGVELAADTANVQALMDRFAALAVATDALADNALQCEGLPAFADRAALALAYGYAALATRNDLQRVSVLALGVPLDTDVTGHTQSSVRRDLDAVRHTPDSPGPDHAQVQPHVAAFRRSLDAMLQVRRDRAESADDPAVALRAFDDLSGHAELLMQAANMDLDTGYPRAAVESADEIYAVGLTALRCYHRWAARAHTPAPEIDDFAADFAAALEDLARRPRMPALNKSSAWAGYQRARGDSVGGDNTGD